MIIVNWNSGADLSRLLQDLDGQRDVAIDTLVVDNGSSDDSLQRAHDAGLRYDALLTGENLGYSGGNNRGFAARPTADLVLVINPDVRLDDRFVVRRLADLLVDHPQLAALAPTITVGEDVIEYRASEIDLERAIALHRETHVESWSEGTPEVVELCWIDGAALLFRRQALDEIGGFDARFFLFQEEVDWCLRAADAGWRVGVARDLRVRHARSSSFGLSTKGAYYYWRNLYLLCHKHARGRVGWRWHWGRQLLRFSLRRRHLRDGRSLRALTAAADAIRGRYGPAADDRRRAA